jgi:hypothetical protein
VVVFLEPCHEHFLPSECIIISVYRSKISALRSKSILNTDRIEIHIPHSSMYA